MSNILYVLALGLFLIASWSLLAGKVFLGGEVVSRKTSPRQFFLGVFAYLIVAMFSVLFGVLM